MNNPKLPPIRVPREGVIDPSQLRARQIAEEEKKRFEAGAEKIIEILKKENFRFRELSRVWSTVIATLGERIESSTIDKILKLRENDKNKGKNQMET